MKALFVLAFASAYSILSSFLGVVQPAVAVPSNSSFETGNFTGWQTTGKTSIKTSTFGRRPTEGTFQALLSTGNLTVRDSSLEAFLGLPIRSLDALGNGNATSGSAIKQTFTANAGDVLAFDWNFLTNEFPPTLYNDFSFFVLGSLSEIADTKSAIFLNSPTTFRRETGFHTFSLTLPTTGTYTLGFGIVDVSDKIVESGLLIDNVRLVSIPEPTSTLGWLGGALSIGLGLRRRRK